MPEGSLPTAAAEPHELRAALHDAHAYFRQPRTLDSSWVPDYLNRRNLYPQMGVAGIGYAPGGWSTLLDHLRSRGHTDDALVGAGLARLASTGNLIDHFRDRLMVPVSDAQRHLVGFVGRAGPTAGPDVPKYVNSPATALFDKRQVLYALGEDRAELQGGAMPILVEGPLDRLALRQAAGNLAIVGLAPLGTALTRDQATLLARVIGPRRPVGVALDADPAGRLAAVRAWDQLTGAGLTNLLHIALPEGRDPADLVRAGHGRHLRHAIVHARPLAFAVADQRIADASQTSNLDHLEKRYAVLRHVLDRDLLRVPIDRIGPYLGHLAARLQLDHETVTAAAADRISPTTEVEAFTASICSAESFPAVDNPPSGSGGHDLSARGTEDRRHHPTLDRD